MKRSSLKKMAATMLACGPALSAAQALATPTVTSAVLHTRVFNDFPNSALTFGDAYPASVFIQDDNSNAPPPPGFANLHNWHFSENNFTDANFNNVDAFSFSSNLVVTAAAPTVAEAGLQVAPWWSQDVDGRLQVRVQDGEIAAFGGRLPFFSFTGTFGITYTAGTIINLGISYDPNSLSMADPGTIKYDVVYGGNSYSSGWLAFDQGNPGEDPPHGLWGILNDARVGGIFQAFNGTGGLARADWTNITFVPEPATLALLAVGGLVLARRKSR